METIGRYDKSEIDLFPQMLAHLVEELERHAECPVDVLGVIFHDLELHNKYKGQFFTPQHICDVMGKMSLGEIDKAIAEDGYLTVCEPCCGSGAMVLGLAKAMQDCKYDFQRQMVVTAIDVDLKCVYMTYLQLSLYGIPAVVIYGNSLTNEEWSRWYTPVYLLNGWHFRKSFETEQVKQRDKNLKGKSESMSEEQQKNHYDIELKESDRGQLRFDL